MKPRPKLRKAAKWTGVATTLLLVVAWFYFTFSDQMFGPEDGIWFATLGQGTLTLYVSSNAPDPIGDTPALFPAGAPPHIYIIKVWWVLLVTLTATAYAWRLDSVATRKLATNSDRGGGVSGVRRVGLSRCINRRKLLIVVALAAFFGGVLPYAVCVGAGGGVLGGAKGSQFKQGKIRVFRLLGLLDECVSLDWIGGAPTNDEWIWIVSECENLIPADTLEFQMLAPSGRVTVVQYGWPFRAAHMCRSSDRATGLVLECSTRLDMTKTGWASLGKLAPKQFPLGVRWTGVAGNVFFSVLFFAFAYSGLTYWRARQRVDIGKCFKCGYLSNAASVCPECGTSA